MNIIRKIERKLKSILTLHYYRKSIRNKGGRFEVSKCVILGEFKHGSNLIINNDGIENTKRSQIVVLPNAILEIGDNVGMSQVSITVKERVNIGNNVKIGAGTMIFDTNFHSSDWNVRRSHDLDKVEAKHLPVIIEDDCFIGARTIICKGVTIGARSIVAAGSVVIKNIPADSIAGGNPCRVIKSLK